jgi:hypothetical protein
LRCNNRTSTWTVLFVVWINSAHRPINL